jgi:hypothetical protein
MERAAHDVFQLLAAMLPALYAADEEHRPAADIIARIMAAAQDTGA